MWITKKSGYGLIAMAELACSDEDCYKSTTEVADKYDLPHPFLEKIMRELKHADLVEVKRGRGGGYELTLEPTDITVKDVILALEEDTYAPVTCLSPGDHSDCPLREKCPTVQVWRQIHEEFCSVLESFTLEDFSSILDS